MTTTAASRDNVLQHRDLVTDTSVSAGQATRESSARIKKKGRDLGHGLEVSRGRSQREGRTAAKRSIEIITSSPTDAAP